MNPGDETQITGLGDTIQSLRGQKADNTSAVQNIRCCICGISIPANPTATCTNCLQSHIDVTTGIERNLVLPYCKHCDRYQRPPWLACSWESRELLALCLKRIRGLQGSRRQIRLIDAKFLYTEPHSRRIKVKLTLQKELTGGAVVEQDCIVEYVIQPSQCDDCKRAFTPHIWVAVVQVRQRAEHKRSMMFLEQVILKNSAHEKVLQVVEAPNGLDFQFGSRAAAVKFTEFVSSRLPTRSKTSKQLVSHDPKSNTAFNKHTFSIEISPICKDDLVFLPTQIANNVYGGISSFLLCTRVTSAIQLIDPFSLRGVDIACDKYWKFFFEPLLIRRHLTQFIILDINYVDMRDISTAATASRFLKCKDMNDMQDDASKSNFAAAHQSKLVEVEVARAADFGVNDNRIQCRSHLGESLRVGDWWLGYDLTTINLGGSDETSDLRSKIPFDVILVRKAPQNRGKRSWVLQRLPIEKATDGPLNEDSRVDLEDFKEDLEADPHLRREVNLWKDPQATIEIGEDVTLCELLQNLTLEDLQSHTYE